MKQVIRPISYKITSIRQQLPGNLALDVHCKHIWWETRQAVRWSKFDPFRRDLFARVYQNEKRK